MRKALSSWTIGLTLLLGGCDGPRGDYSATVTPQPSDVAVINYQRAMAAPSACERTARERAADVRAQGFDGGIQKTVHDATYADCARWAEWGK